MKRTKILLTILCCLVFTSGASADTIKDGTILYSASHYLAGEPLKTGYDIFGYNYQAHLFNGSYYNFNTFGLPPYEGNDDAYYQRLVDEGFATDIDDAKTKVTAYWPWRDVTLTMKWNDAWISNQDRGDDAGGTVPDGKLDRHYGFGSYIGSGAWETNHMSGSYEIEINGKTKKAHWTYFVKIMAVPADAYLVDATWYDGDSGVEIGPVIWGDFATIQQVENDPFAGIHGKQYGSPAGPGFGQYKP